MVYGGPLFMHQLSHIWIDFRGIRDAYLRAKNLDYFDNSRRATLLQQRYAIDNPLRFPGYGAQGWGITACEGPGAKTLKIDGIEMIAAPAGVGFAPRDRQAGDKSAGEHAVFMDFYDGGRAPQQQERLSIQQSL